MKGKFLRGAVTGLAAAGLLLLGGYGAVRDVDSHYTGKLDRRYEQYYEDVSKWPEDWRKNYPREEKPVLPMMQRIGRARRLQCLETNFARNLPQLRRFFESKTEYLRDLTDVSFEKGGYLVETDGGFEIREVDAPEGRIIQYFSEMFAGDYTHTKELLDYSGSLESLLGGRVQSFTKQSFSSTIFNLKSYQKYADLDENEKRALEKLEYYADDGTKHLGSPKDVVQIYERALKRLQSVSTLLTGFYNRTVTNLDSDEIFSVFHTHPVSRDIDAESPPDVSSTYIMGPEIVIARKDDTLRVYGVNRGQVVEILRFILD